MTDAGSLTPSPVANREADADRGSSVAAAAGAALRRERLASVALFVLALLPRLYVALAWAREPVWDGHYYDLGARRIAAGLGYSDDLVIDGRTVWHPWCHYPVGYSGFLALVYLLFGAGPRVAPLANAVVGALTAVLAHRLALLALPPWRARLAGALVALAPGLVANAALLMTESLAATGLLLALYLAVRDRDRHPWRGAVAGGIALGLGTLVRPQSILLAPLLGLASLGGARPRAPRRVVALGAVATAAALAVVAPWTARNCRVMDGCAFVSTNAGWNLAIGAFPRATGRFETLRASDGCRVVTGQVQQDRCWMQVGLDAIRADPLRWIGLVPRKLSLTFDHESFPVGYLAEADPAAWPEPRRAAFRDLLTNAHRTLLALAPLAFIAGLGALGARARGVQLGLFTAVIALAAWAAFDKAHPFWPLALVVPLLALLPAPGAPPRDGALVLLALAVASVALTHAVFFGEDRYHVVITPALCLLAAAALRRPAERRSAAPSGTPRGDAADRPVC